METQKLDELIRLISKGDTRFFETLFARPGGRKFIESTVVIILSTLPQRQQEKEEVFIAFLKALNKIEKRIHGQKEGETILQQLGEN